MSENLKEIAGIIYKRLRLELTQCFQSLVAYIFVSDRPAPAFRIALSRPRRMTDSMPRREKKFEWCDEFDLFNGASVAVYKDQVSAIPF